MNEHLKRTLVNVAPPIVIKAGRVTREYFSRGRTIAEWEAVSGGVSVWEKSTGWSHRSIVEVQRARWPAFEENTRSPRQFGLWPGGTQIDIGLHNLIMTFGYVLGLAADQNTHLSVLDWGGGLGHYYVYARELHPQLTFDYVIKDLPAFCDAGRFLLPQVHYICDDDVALSRRYDLVFASSSAHYARQIYDTIEGLARSAAMWLMITRLPCVFRSDDFVVMQRPFSHGYMTEYPCWFLNREKFIGFTEARGFVLRREFLQVEAPLVRNAPEQCRYSGFLFQRTTSI